MTKEEILEANKLFAEYLGYKYFPKIDNEESPGWRKDTVIKGHGYLCRNHNQLPFYKDWNWMMKLNIKLSDELSSLHKHEHPDINFIHFKLNTMNGDIKEAFFSLYKYFKNKNNE